MKINKITLVLLTLLISITLVIPVHAGQTLYELVLSPHTLFTNGRLLTSTELPILNYNGNTYIPLRIAGEALGAEVQFDPVTKVINIHSKAENTIETIAENVKSTVRIKTYGDLVGTAPLGSGSGVIVANDMIVTNSHVIEDAIRYGVSYNDTAEGREYRRSGWFALEMLRDIAIIPSVNLIQTPAVMGDSDALRLGEKVVAIGSPMGLKNTVSEGIISGFRIIDGFKFIQTTAPISPGSSGGGLYNTNNELIGITTLKIIDGESLNFAIPINDVRELMEQKTTLINVVLYDMMSWYSYGDDRYRFNSLCYPGYDCYYMNYYLAEEHEGADKFEANFYDPQFQSSFMEKLQTIHSYIGQHGYLNYELSIKVNDSRYTIRCTNGVREVTENTF